MFLLNLSLGELLALVGAVSAGVTALYLLDRARRRQIVPTLRFWLAAQNPTEIRHRRRIQQPWSLVLQLLSLALLLTAIAELQWGDRDTASRDHVIVLDTSAWMGARARQGTLMDEARALARSYVRALPAADRVMLVRADALATPATGFEDNRAQLEEAIRRSLPGAAALNLGLAFDYAQQAQKLHARRAGEIVYIGSGRTSADGNTESAPAQLRVLPVAGAPENLGIRKMGLRRASSDAGVWEIFVAVKNYGQREQVTTLTLQFGGAPAGTQAMKLKPGAEEHATFSWRTRSAGIMEARLISKDGFPQDDRAALELPAQVALRIHVYSNEPALLRPVFATNPHLEAVFEPIAAYNPEVKAGVVVLDRFSPDVPPKADSIWIASPKPPIAVKATRSGARLTRWNGDTLLGNGLRTKDVALDEVQVLAPGAGDIVVAESDAGPVMVARSGRQKTVVMGFHPVRSAMKYELATPLVFANIVRWMAPETFRRFEVHAGTVGTVNVSLEGGAAGESAKVTTDGKPLPFTVENNALRFFAGAPGQVRVEAENRDLVYSLTLPDVADTAWKAPSGARRGIPRGYGAAAATAELWPWLALLGGVGLLVDWLLFGRWRARRFLPAGAKSTGLRSNWRKAS